MTVPLPMPAGFLSIMRTMLCRYGRRAKLLAALLAER